MGKYMGPKCKVSRKIGFNLLLKSSFGKNITSKCKAKIHLGINNKKKPRISDYALQLKAKQTLKYVYGVLEKQFYLYYKKARKSHGITSDLLLEFLESRLDNVVYRMGFASTRAEARQLINHKSVIVIKNKISNIISIPSFALNPQDTVKIRKVSRKQIRIKDSLRQTENVIVFPWLSIDKKNMIGVFKRKPTRHELPSDYNEKLILELYSK